MHFTGDISLGQILVSVPVFALMGMVYSLSRKITLFRVEHEYLMADYCERHGLPLMTLPTRQKGIL